MSDDIVYRQLDTFEGYTKDRRYYSFTKWNDEELDIQFNRTDVTLTKDEAIRLRDFLIKNYPISPKCKCEECNKSEQLNSE